MKRRKVIVVAFLGVAVAAAIIISMLKGGLSENTAALRAREAAMRKLGEAIATLRPNAKVLVLANPFAKQSGWREQNAQFERAGLRGLRRGLGAAEVIVEAPELRSDYLADPQSVAIPPDTRTPLSFLVRPEAIEKLATVHPNCTAIISLIGFPLGLEQSALWRTEDLRTFAFLLPDFRVLGSADKVIEAFERGKIVAVVTEEKAGSGTAAPLLVTRENLREVIQLQPQVLGY